MIKLNLEKLSNRKTEEPIKIFGKFDAKLKKALKELEKIDGSTKIMSNWLDSCKKINTDMIKNVINIANKLKKLNIKDVLLIGQNHLLVGPKAMVETLSSHVTSAMQFHYVDNLSNKSMNNLTKTMSRLSNFIIIVMEESNNTFEIDINLRNYYQILLDKIGAEKANQQVVIIAKSDNYDLWKLANKYQWTSFPLAKDIKIKYSALTPLFLLPMELASIDIKEFIKGVVLANNDTKKQSTLQNTSYQYAIIKKYFHTSFQSKVELMTIYDDSLLPLLKLLETMMNDFSVRKKLMASTRNCATISLLYSDNHIFKNQQDLFFETAITLKKSNELDISISDPFQDLNKKGYRKDWKLSEILKSIEEVVIEQHSISNSIPTLIIELDEISPKSIGYMYTWFVKSNIINLILNNINPFEDNYHTSLYQNVLENLKNNSDELLKETDSLNSFKTAVIDEEVIED